MAKVSVLMSRGSSVPIACPWNYRSDYCPHIRRPSNVAEAQWVPAIWGQSLLYIVGWHPILCLGKELGVCVLRFGYFLAEVRVVRTLRVESNRIGPVVELVNHPALIQR